MSILEVDNIDFICMPHPWHLIFIIYSIGNLEALTKFTVPCISLKIVSGLTLPLGFINSARLDLILVHMGRSQVELEHRFLARMLWHCLVCKYIYMIHNSPEISHDSPEISKGILNVKNTDFWSF